MWKICNSGANFRATLLEINRNKLKHKGNITWISFDKWGILYLVGDKEYILYDKYNEEKRRATGEEIEQISQEEKQKINDYYKNK